MPAASAPTDMEMQQLIIEVSNIANESMFADAIGAAYRIYGSRFVSAYQQLKAGNAQDADPVEQACLSYRESFKAFALRFFPHYCTVEFSAMHEEFFETFDADYDKRDLRDVTAAPRSNAKTTIRTIIKTIYDICFGLEDFVLIMSSRLQPLAQDKVQDIRDELELNADLKSHFGYAGAFMTQDWGQTDFIARNRWGHEVRVIAGSPKSQVRGFLWRGRRPTKIILDDIENSEHVVNEVQRRKLETWLTSDVSKLGTLNPGGRRLNIDFVGTVLHPESLLAKQLQNPGYRAAHYQSIISFAHNTELWARWRDLFVDLSDEDRADTARAFFADHEDEMLAGSQVLWPAGETYYDLMVSRITEGESSFWQEKQNNPLESNTYPFQMDQAAYVEVQTDRIVRADGTHVLYRDITDVVAFWDPTPGDATGRDPDYSACVIVMSDHYGYIYVMDAYMSQDDNATVQVRRVAQLLADWGVSRVGLEANAFQSLLTANLREEIAALHDDYPNWMIRVDPIKQRHNKEQRIFSLEPMIANKWLQFSSRLPAPYYSQFASWLPVRDSGHDDGPDATEGAIRVLRHMGY